METGQVIKGYEIRERIGGGGFGNVYRAYQSTLGREVAIKIVLPRYANEPDFIRRFESEARFIAKLEHRCIVPLYDFWRDPDGAYLVMRLLRGGSVADALAQHGPYEMLAAVRLIEQIAAALDVAHHNNVVHRDIKPANILLDEDGDAYLSDFNIAKDTLHPDDGQTGTNMILGSPGYMSPEQGRSEPVSPRSDIYSLAVVLYEVLTGEHPFPGLSGVKLLYKHLEDPLPLIKALQNGVSESVLDDINAVIQCAGAKNPAERYETVRAMANALRQAASLSDTQIGETIVEQLTPREQEILHLIIDGCTNKEIAQSLYISLSTVKWYIRQLYKKLGVRSRVQAMVRARELDLVVAAPENGDTVTTGATYVLQPEPENPYKGLHAFETADVRDFFGRERLTQKLIERLGETGKHARFLAVVGPSGSGKSSVVKAGLIPALWRGDLPGSERWFVVEMEPGEQPLDELEVALTRIVSEQNINVHEQLTRDANGLTRIASLILPDDDSELVIIVDQFEEVFTLVEDETRRAHFLALLHAAVTASRSRVRVVITLRADFYDRPLHYPNFGELVRERMETVLPLSAEELEAAILNPAERAGVKFEEGLAATITADVHYQSGALPLLQYALTELFEQHENRTLTAAAYAELGGAVGALAKRADDVYHEQDDAGQEAIRQMFLRLVTLGEGTEDTRRRVLRSELLAAAADQDLMDEIIDTYAAYRLLTLDYDPATRRPTVEIAHEAILQQWARLGTWLDESRHDIRQQRLLANAAQQWQEHNRDTSYLLMGTRLEQFSAWSQETDVALTNDERAFLDASLAEEQRQQDTERERQQREIALARRSANRLRYLVGAMAVFLAVAVGLIGITNNALGTARDERDKAEREAVVNNSLVLASNAQNSYETGYTDTALLLALEATNIEDPPTEAINVLRDIRNGVGTLAILEGHTNGVNTIALSSDGTYALSGGCADLSGNICHQGELIVWNMRTLAEEYRITAHTDDITYVVFHPTDLTALSASKDGTMMLWDIASGEHLNTFEGHTGGVNDVRLSSDGLTAVSASDDQTLILWDIVSGTVIRRFEGHTEAVTTVSFSADDQYIASGSDDHTVILWDTATADLIVQSAPYLHAIIHVFFDPGFDDGTGSLWWTAGNHIAEWKLEDGQNVVVSGAYAYSNFTGALLVDAQQPYLIVGFGITIRMLNLPRLNEFERMEDHEAQILSMALSADSRTLLSGSIDGTIRVWTLNPIEPLHILQNDTWHAGANMARSPDGKWLILGGVYSNESVLVDIDKRSATYGQILQRFDSGLANSMVLTPIFSPDSSAVAIPSGEWYGGSGASNLILWDVETGQKLQTFVGHKYLISGLAFTPDGKYLLSGSNQFGPAWEKSGDGDLILWDVATGGIAREFEGPGDIRDAAINSDATRAVTSSWSGNGVIVWDMQSGAKLAHLENDKPVLDVMFGPEEAETSVLAATLDTGIIQWDFETGEIIRRFPAMYGATFKIDFSPDKQYLVASGAGEVVVWDFDTMQEVKRFDVSYALNGFLTVAYDISGDSIYIAGPYSELVFEMEVADEPLAELRTWVLENRYIRDFTCEKRAQYNVEPLCN